MIAMIEFILFVVISSFVINGWYEITRNGKVFGWWERFWEHYYQEKHEDPPKYKFPHWVRFPISQCVMCGASVYGTTIFATVLLFFNLLDPYSLTQMIFIYIGYLLCLTCTNYIVHKKLQ